MNSQNACPGVYLGGRDWLHRELDLMQDAAGVEFQGNIVVALTIIDTDILIDVGRGDTRAVKKVSLLCKILWPTFGQFAITKISLKSAIGSNQSNRHNRIKRISCY